MMPTIRLLNRAVRSPQTRTGPVSASAYHSRPNQKTLLHLIFYAP
jgi:hypothetical protein